MQGGAVLSPAGIAIMAVSTVDLSQRHCAAFVMHVHQVVPSM